MDRFLIRKRQGIEKLQISTHYIIYYTPLSLACLNNNSIYLHTHRWCMLLLGVCVCIINIYSSFRRAQGKMLSDIFTVFWNLVKSSSKFPHCLNLYGVLLYKLCLNFTDVQVEPNFSMIYTIKFNFFYKGICLSKKIVHLICVTHSKVVFFTAGRLKIVVLKL